MEIKKALKELRKSKRKFSQTFDLIINTKNLDLSKPDNRFTKKVKLPNGPGKEIKVGVIGEKQGDIQKKDIEDAGKDDRKLKDLFKKYDFLISEAPLMPFIGKRAGKLLAPSGKMPDPFPPGSNPEEMKKNLEKSVCLRLKDSPNIQCPVGNEKMEDEEMEENIKTVIRAVLKALPKGRNQIKHVLLKLTMSKPIKLSGDIYE